MTGGGTDDPQGSGAAGGPARHVPVLSEEVLTALAPREGAYLDATFGAGGYTRRILGHPGTRVVALDRDPTAIANGQALVAEMAGRLKLVEARFSTLEAAARGSDMGPFLGVVFDIGVSSMQLDEAERGFSFRFDGPLDMRMAGTGRSAAEIVNEETEERLADIFYHFGEERASRRIARAIVADRRATPFRSTRQLAELIARLLPSKPNEIHPATRSFQALRIAVNEELDELVKGLAAAERLLPEDGRLAVVTFHSLEDRIVKLFFAARSGRGATTGRLLPGEAAPATPSFLCPRPQPIAPSADETRVNPRARSAKLRFGIRTSAAPHPLEGSLIDLAHLPEATPRGPAAKGKSR